MNIGSRGREQENEREKKPQTHSDGAGGEGLHDFAVANHQKQKLSKH